MRRWSAILVSVSVAALCACSSSDPKKPDTNNTNWGGQAGGGGQPNVGGTAGVGGVGGAGGGGGGGGNMGPGYKPTEAEIAKCRTDDKTKMIDDADTWLKCMCETCYYEMYKVCWNTDEKCGDIETEYDACVDAEIAAGTEEPYDVCLAKYKGKNAAFDAEKACEELAACE